MRQVIEIMYIDERVSKEGDTYWITTVLLDDGTEAEFWGKGLRVGDELEVFFHKERIKARKTPPKLDNTE